MLRALLSVLLVVGVSACNCGNGGPLDGGVDAGQDAGRDGGVDAGTDAGNDAGLDAGLDGGTDGGLAALCLGTGGNISTAACCLSTSDFPNLCTVGACGCAPANSHDVQVCACGTGCFDPAVGCVRPDAGVDGGADGGAEGLCLGTGGTVVESLCCLATSDFPNLCAVGACGCAPGSSHQVRTCSCPGGQCYEPGVGCR